MMGRWESDRVSVSELGERLQLDSGTLTPLLKKLESMSHLTRARDDRDGRVVRVSLTPGGRALRKKALAVPKGLFCQLGLDLPGLVRLREELTTLTRTLRAASAERQHLEHTP